MKIAKYLLALTLAFTPLPVLANTVAIPNTFVNGQFIDANLFNQNFQAIATFANGNIDATNIGAAGIYGSQIIPTNALQAIFGGTIKYKFNNGLTVASGLTVTGGSTVAGGLTVTGGITADNLTVSGTLSPGALTVAGATNLAATTFSAAPTMSGANITARTIPNAAIVTTPLTALTAGANITLTGSAPNITITGTSNPSGIVSYTISGTATPTVPHHVFTTTLFNAQAQTSIIFSGAAVFSNASTFACSAGNVNINGTGFYFNTNSGANVTVNTQSGAVTSGTVTVHCFGY